ncbi:MAG: enoyl-CoA hydratase-related protein [Paracoccus sp. (in: a-proteobacteria)]|jgi:2-(1,2-epoxy-1,2-dihydrophenyl)acetyl-CoA isomerase|uniref:enoyl-CoA hydratase-related protein n=1 Tax=unclassified Paracoccus (in: a-proteobacteria) TaxID=2688777 RepID=UPI000C513021|nr:MULTISPECIES: enoyl-CoA hydratase-related protein [unclassified Paracoccus (in: a-proteobacteria)]MAN57132.1 2-(1,2-epoxy-1,2-dihydrophenyl)acetyl-CoA isomerase [Paracoccus sp. (in: a-proteobacteria)]MBA50259.1 2-(1,2-epoxy-1,2-dihydrophenyl)acetyl-CoA isomerase [Paracoccus sp. (in: a-proteobacteria)]MDB2552100.1 enoyl-CoA hydratase-related protein [Paracoccus sp. (in: a-proteobacteria)]|tara:strand:+ start:1481 stop:2251 length:771 start_codon:yes stop_codon:yes gene_type:complete
MTHETIQFAVADGIATLVLNRPEVMNALNSRMRAEITEALTTLPEEARCVVLTGSGRAFCSGQDLGDAGAAADLEATLRDEYEPMLRAITGCRAPVIAAVNGVAAGAGANLALAADVVIAAEGASFIQAFTRIGLVPDAGGTFIIPRAIGAARAMGMMLFADAIPARQAADWGLIWDAVADADFAEEVAARARKLAQGPTGAYLSIRHALAAAFCNDMETQLALEARLQGEAGRSADFREGVAAFLEKRPARFIGR